MKLILVVIVVALLGCGHEQTLTSDVDALHNELSGNYVVSFAMYVNQHHDEIVVATPSTTTGSLVITGKHLKFNIETLIPFRPGDRFGRDLHIVGDYDFELDNERGVMRLFNNDGSFYREIQYLWDGRRLLLSHGAALLKDVLWLKIDAPVN